jgi:hypothetical protein
MKTFASLCIILGVLFVGATWASEAAPFALRLATNGDVALGGGDVALGLRIHKEGWTGTITGEPIWEELSGRGRLARDDDESAGDPPAPPVIPFRMKDDSGAVCVTGQVVLVAQAARPEDSPHPSSAILSLRATALSPIRAESVAMEFTIPSKDAAGLEWRAGDAARGVFPERYGELRLWRGMTDSFSFVDPETRKPVELRFPQPMSLLLQDSRLWGPNFSVRIEIGGGARFRATEVAGEPPATRQFAFDCEISHPDGIAVERDEIAAIEAGDDWTPLENRKNIVAGSALDFSAMGWTDAPAGKHGWLKAVDGHFEFEGLPGVEQRFYGVNLCETANFPDHAMADELVTRLKRLGYNSIRLHHHDGIWKDAIVSRKVEKLKSKKVPQQSAPDNQPFNLSTFQPFNFDEGDDIDRFDYLAAVAISNGIYVTTDLYVSRNVAWRDIGFDRDGFVPNNVFKSLVALHEPAFENWASFARDFLLHENPYTGRRYVDEPGMPLLCLVNEGPMKWAWSTVKKMDCVKEKWREWRKRECSQSFAIDNCSQIGNFADSAAAQCFAAYVEREAFEREKAFLESLGCKALLTSQNCADNQAMASMRSAYDYVDNHFYHGNPQFLGTLWKGAFRFDGGNPAKAEGLSLVNAAFTRIVGKPYTITEWNFSGPSRHRAAGALLAGTMAARQEWSGMWRFAYSHVERGLADGYGAPHLFDLAVDPVNLASERAVMCLFLRGDMAPLETKVALDVGAPRIPQDGKSAANRPEWMDEAWRIQVGRVAGERPLFTNDNWHNCSQIANIHSAPPVAPENRPDFIIDREAGSVIVATPRTCGVFAEGGAHEAGALRVEFLATKNTKERKDFVNSVSFVAKNNPVNPVNDVSETSAPLRLCVENNPATVFATSLDGAPLETSSRILVTHLTDAQAEGNVFAGRARDTLLKWGKGRTLVRNGAARVSLALAAPESCEVWGLATDGTRMERVPATAENGSLSFTADVDSSRGARMFYEILRVPGNQRRAPDAFPSYRQRFVATFATEEEAATAECSVAPLPGGASLAFGCRWDDTNPAHLAKASMMERVGVKGTFYLCADSSEFFRTGLRKLVDGGHAIGNHTMGHPNLFAVNPNAGFRAIAENRIVLETAVGRPITSYVNPYGWGDNPIDPDHRQTLLACIMATGHFVTQDNPRSWGKGPPDALAFMPCWRFSAGDAQPSRELFEKGFREMLGKASSSSEVPRLGFGTHSWCNAEGNDLQETLLREYCVRPDWAQLNDWEYGAYRREALHGGIRKVSADGDTVTFEATRFFPAQTGDAIPLSLKFSGAEPLCVRTADGALARGGRGTWTLPHADDAGRLHDRIARTGADGRCTAFPGLRVAVEPDEAEGRLRVRVENGTGRVLRRLFVAAAFPPKWSLRSARAECGLLADGAVFECALEMGSVVREDYAFGSACYPVSVDFADGAELFRVWAEKSMPRVEVPGTAPSRAARVWGPADATALFGADWAAASEPGAPLPDETNWRTPERSGPDALWSLVERPRSCHGESNAGVRALAADPEQGRFVVYDFVSPEAKSLRLRTTVEAGRRNVALWVNGERLPYSGPVQAVEARKGRNRIVLRADLVAVSDWWTDGLYLAVTGPDGFAEIR